VTILSDDEIIEKIKFIADWKRDNIFLTKEFCFNDFAEAVSFVVHVSFIAEKLDHHPDIYLHSWNKVKITISTHQVNKLTEKDFQLAYEINQISSRK